MVRSLPHTESMLYNYVFLRLCPLPNMPSLMDTVDAQISKQKKIRAHTF